MQPWLLLDAMGVVYPVGDDVRDLLFPFLRARNPALEFSRLQEAYIQASLGRLSCDAFWRAVGAGLDDPGQLQREYLLTCLTVDEELLPALTKLRERYQLAMLSNDVGEWSQFLRERFGLCSLFEHAVISGGVGTQARPKDLPDCVDDLGRSRGGLRICRRSDPQPAACARTGLSRCAL